MNQTLLVTPIFCFHCSAEMENIGKMSESAARFDNVLNIDRACFTWLHLPHWTLAKGTVTMKNV